MNSKITVRDGKRTPLYVSKPLLPSLPNLNRRLTEIWQTGHVTNNGPLSQELEKRLSIFLQSPTALLFNNGTTGILAALKLFDLPCGSEVITTPMTFAATAHSISWNNLKPVFVDILEENLTIDPAAVELAITDRTSAIFAVHAYGCICAHDHLDRLAKKHGLKLIYDAAHAFGSTVDGKSVATLGDASIFSFHATKLFNTIEGGMVTTPFQADYEPLYLLRNFGIKNEDEVLSVGLNGKINELQAAIGLLNLEIFEDERAARRELRGEYTRILCGLQGVTVQEVGSDVAQSEQYFLVRINAEKFGQSRDDVKKRLEEKGIFCRKYFFPLCTDYEPYKNFGIVSTGSSPYAEIAKYEVLCLPFHSSVERHHIDLIGEVFRR